MQLTYRLAMAAGRDAGERSMRKAGRTQWNEQDWNIATETTEHLLGMEICFPPPPPSRRANHNDR